MADRSTRRAAGDHTLGPNLFEPANSAFWDAVRAEQPALYKGFNPWDRICDPPSVRAALEAGGATVTAVVAVPGKHPVDSPEDWWAMLIGSGYRGTIAQLDVEARERVGQANPRLKARHEDGLL